jgi:[ribosomal protein S5]-alanine N-acetyltransferase
MTDPLLTPRLLLRRPTRHDAAAIFERYASDPDVTRYLAWPRHSSIEDTYVFLGFSESEWRRWGCGPYLAYSRSDGSLLGSTGLAFEATDVASTGYVFARDAWGKGYATEALSAMVDVARALRLRRLYAICHVDHHASWRVMEKCGFEREGVLSRHTVFPNISSQPCDVLSYAHPIAMRAPAAMRA